MLIVSYKFIWLVEVILMLHTLFEDFTLVLPLPPLPHEICNLHIQLDDADNISDVSIS